MTKKDFLSIDDLSPKELTALLDEADKIKRRPERYANRLGRMQVALIFEKPSTRTRVSFEVAVTSMGGHVLTLRSDELQLGRGETIEDTGRVLSRYVDCIVVRTFGHDRLERLAADAAVPVVNALSDYSHPCQALADMQTIRERKGRFRKKSLAYLGDGNNVAHSLMLAGTKLAMDIRIACPPGHAPDDRVLARARAIAAMSGGKMSVTDIVSEAVHRADVVYTDVWASMGQEDEAEARRERFQNYQVNSETLGLAAKDVIVLHCLPAHRGEEITDEVMDGEHSAVWDQAENRLHTQKALLLSLLT